MDEPGFRARRRADKEQQAAFTGRHGGLTDVVPLTDEQINAQIDVPEHDGATGFAVPNYRPPPAVPNADLPGAISGGEGLQGTYTEPGPHKDDPAAAKLGMNPHLQIMLGPMLRYDTMKDGIYHAFCMVVTADTGSVYQPKPYLSWYAQAHGGLEQGMQNVGLNGSGTWKTIEASSIYTYHSLAGGNTFWRFKLEIPLADAEQAITYSLNGGRTVQFFIPGRSQNMKWVGHSCNGFSAGVKVEDFNGPSPLWDDLLARHKTAPYHCLVGGGDQIYCDPLAREPEYVDWIGSKDEEWKANHPLTDDMKFALDRFFFNHYCAWFRNGAFGRAIARIPMLNMLDDHDLIDGFGSYPDKLQTSAVFSSIGSRGYFWYLLFQNFIVDEFDGTSPQIGTHSSKSMIIGGEGVYIPFPNHSFLSCLGPNQYILLLDCRAERKKTQICSKVTYERVFQQINQLPAEVEHLCVLVGVPIAYPRMIFAEKFMESSFNPLTALAKTGSFGLGGMLNKFNGQAELLDDLSDHWTATDHKEERNWLVCQCAQLAKNNKLRISFLSGDVHAGAIAKFFSKHHVDPARDPNYMLNIISSAIVNTPPPQPMISLLNKICTKTHKTLHKQGIDEDMEATFTVDPETGKPQSKNQYIVGRRNYVSVSVTPEGDQIWDLRVEMKQGGGETRSYPTIAPRAAYV